MASLSNASLMLIFIGTAVVTWIAGVSLARATDVLDDRFGLGEASGGVAVQTFVLVIADWFGWGRPPLSTAVASLVPALEGLLLIAVVCVTIMGGLLPASASIGPLGVAAMGILVVWIAGMMILNRVRSRPGLSFARTGETAEETKLNEDTADKKQSARRTILIFVIASIVTLFAGVLLEQSGNTLADNFGIYGVRMQRYTLAFGDMFGGNAFQLTLFIVADPVAGWPVLPYEGVSNAWIAAMGLLMTAVFVAGIILRPSKPYAGHGSGFLGRDRHLYSQFVRTIDCFSVSKERVFHGQS